MTIQNHCNYDHSTTSDLNDAFRDCLKYKGDEGCKSPGTLDNNVVLECIGKRSACIGKVPPSQNHLNQTLLSLIGY